MREIESVINLFSQARHRKYFLLITELVLHQHNLYQQKTFIAETCMQTLNYTIGNWRAEARVEEVETGKLMAVISVNDQQGSVMGKSKHTVVFDHEEGKDHGEETQVLVHRLLRNRYGI
jgi:hypothetical protein